jgi:dipeptidyl aminopeptidase/acylaminoacyl peptidase
MSQQMADEETLEALASLPTQAQPTVSNDGESVALYYDESGRNELHVLDAATGELSQWSDGEVPRDAGSGVAWDVDDERVFFHHDEDGDELFDIHTIDSDGTVETVLETDGQTGLQDISPDGDRILVASSHGGQINIYSHDLTSDETTQITDYERAASGAKYAPDGDRICYTTNESADYDNCDVYIADADGSNTRNLEIGATGAESVPVDWHPDGRRLLVFDNTPSLGRSGVYDLDADEVSWYTDPDSEESPQFFVDEERFVATRNREGCVVPVVYDIETGESREFDLPAGVASFGGLGWGSAASYVLDDNRVIFQHEGPTRRPELLAYNLDTDEYEVLLGAEYGPFDREDFAEAEYFRFDSDGVPETPARAVEHDPSEELEIGGILYDSGERPSPPSDRRSDEDRSATRGSPLIVNPHGGPPVYEKQTFDVFTQFLASRGYSVLQINYRGSAGRGREFKERLHDDWGGAEQGDIAGAAEHVLDTREWIDDEQIVMYGRSYGGFSAYWQGVQYPDLYDAVIAWVGLTDLLDMYENTMPHFKSELMVKYLGDPEENRDLYEERSAINYAENVDSPLLMLHGVNDSRVPVSQARLFREKLDELGYQEGEDGDFEYVELGEEGHSSSDAERKKRVFGLLADFLDRRLG